MIRRLIMLFLIFLSLGEVNFLLAESPKSVLKDMRENYKKIKTLKADFNEVFEWAMTGEKIQREGFLYVTDDDKFRIETPEQHLVCDGDAIYRHNISRAQVIIEPMSEEGDNMLPRRLMLRFADDFQATTMTKQAVDGQAGLRLDLVPNSSEEVMLSEVTLWITEQDMIVRRLKVIDLNGNSTTYLFSNIEVNTPQGSDYTKFITPDGVELFDLR